MSHLLGMGLVYQNEPEWFLSDFWSRQPTYTVYNNEVSLTNCWEHADGSSYCLASASVSCPSGQRSLIVALSCSSAFISYTMTRGRRRERAEVGK